MSLTRTRAPSAETDGAGVAHLPARLGVERCLVDDQRHRVAGFGAPSLFAANNQGPDHALGALRAVAEELSRADPLADAEPDRVARSIARACPGPARRLALAFHTGLEALALDRTPLGTERVLGEVEREAEGVVKPERRLPRQARAGGEPGRRLVEQAQAAREGLLEAGLLKLQGRGDERLGTDQLAEGLAHLAHQRGHQAPHQRLGAAHQLGVAHGAAHDPSQHVAAPLVRRHHAVGDEEGARAQVIGNHPVGGAVRTVNRRMPLISTLAAMRLLEQVGFVVVVSALQDRRDPLEPHAGVDRGAGQVDPMLRA